MEKPQHQPGEFILARMNKLIAEHGETASESMLATGFLMALFARHARVDAAAMADEIDRMVSLCDVAGFQIAGATMRTCAELLRST